jgi:hypothetical protein
MQVTAVSTTASDLLASGTTTPAVRPPAQVQPVPGDAGGSFAASATQASSGQHAQTTAPTATPPAQKPQTDQHVADQHAEALYLQRAHAEAELTQGGSAAMIAPVAALYQALADGQFAGTVTASDGQVTNYSLQVMV